MRVCVCAVGCAGGRNIGACGLLLSLTLILSTPRAPADTLRERTSGPAAAAAAEADVEAPGGDPAAMTAAEADDAMVAEEEGGGGGGGARGLPDPPSPSGGAKNAPLPRKGAGEVPWGGSGEADEGALRLEGGGVGV